MRIARSFSELRTLLPRPGSCPLWLVPTMGALHDGHGALIDQAKSEGGFVAVSIFVNPLQFAPGEDLDRYPRTEAEDLAFLDKRGADLVFLPSPGEMVPKSARIRISSGRIGTIYCGASRPGHFDGVLTIVLKLFHLFSPDVALFGEKDRQQLFLIQEMVRDLALPIRVLGLPTIREPDGLAMSSRNRYLSPKERDTAAHFPELMGEAARLWAEHSGHPSKDPLSIPGWLSEALVRAGFRVDYVALADRQTFLPITGGPAPDQAYLLAAVFVGSTRLIDNLELSAERPGV